MANAYIFTLQPTFTQGLLLGQFSILCLLVLVLKYLFFDTDSGLPYKPVSYHPRVATTDDGDESSDSIEAIKPPSNVNSASGEVPVEWLNIILQEVNTVEFERGDLL